MFTSISLSDAGAEAPSDSTGSSARGVGGRLRADGRTAAARVWSRDALLPRTVSAVFAWGLSVLLGAAVLSTAFDVADTTLEERVLRTENEALRTELAAVDGRMERLAGRVDLLARVDQDLYRTLLQVQPVSEDVRQVGVGGTDEELWLDGFSDGTAALMRSTERRLEELERRVMLQTESYRELLRNALRREERLSEMPALLPADGPLVSGYGVRHHPILDVVKMHEGIDVLVSIGTPVVASGDGVVAAVDHSDSYGLFVELAHPVAGYRTFYAHLSSVPRELRRGMRVSRGQVIGYSGDSGRSTGPHLHFEVRDSSGQAVDPVRFFAPTMTPGRYAALQRAARQPTASLD